MNEGRSCEGCSHLISEQWPKGKTAYRCFAEGMRKGRVVAIDHFEAWTGNECRPIWCPEKKDRREYG